MKVTGYRSLVTTHDWGRPGGDVNGIVQSGVTEVPILLLETDSGLTGVGLGQHTDIARVFPAVEGKDPRSVTAIYDAMLSQVFKSGHAGATFGAIAAVDMALWDLKAKMAGEPLWRTLGAADSFVPGYASGLCYGLSDSEFSSHYQSWADRGFSSAKIKGGSDLGRDIERLLTAREIMAANSPRPAMMLDVNESWNAKQAIRHLHEIEEKLDLTWIEEPVRRWDAEGLARVSASGRAAVASGENLTGLDQYAPLFAAGALDVVQAGSVWGITRCSPISAARRSSAPLPPKPAHWARPAWLLWPQGSPLGDRIGKKPDIIRLFRSTIRKRRVIYGARPLRGLSLRRPDLLLLPRLRRVTVWRQVPHDPTETARSVPRAPLRQHRTRMTQ